MPSKHLKQNFWVIKSSISKTGREELLTSNNLDGILSFLQNQALDTQFIIQKVIEKPLIINTKVVRFRFFVLVESNLQVKIFYQAVFNPLIKIEKEINSPSKTLKGNSKQTTRSIEVLGLRELEQYIKANIAENFTLGKDLLPYVQSCILDVVDSMAKSFKSSGPGFEIFGFDFQLDEDLRLWLTGISNEILKDTENEPSGEKILSSALQIVLKAHNFGPGGDLESLWLPIAHASNLKQRFFPTIKRGFYPIKELEIEDAVHANIKQLPVKTALKKHDYKVLERSELSQFRGQCSDIFQTKLVKKGPNFHPFLSDLLEENIDSVNDGPEPQDSRIYDKKRNKNYNDKTISKLPGATKLIISRASPDYFKLKIKAIISLYCLAHPEHYPKKLRKKSFECLSILANNTYDAVILGSDISLNYLLCILTSKSEEIGLTFKLLKNLLSKDIFVRSFTHIIPLLVKTLGPTLLTLGTKNSPCKDLETQADLINIFCTLSGNFSPSIHVPGISHHRERFRLYFILTGGFSVLLNFFMISNNKQFCDIVERQLFNFELVDWILQIKYLESEALGKINFEKNQVETLFSVGNLSKQNSIKNVLIELLEMYKLEMKKLEKSRILIEEMEEPDQVLMEKIEDGTLEEDKNQKERNFEEENQVAKNEEEKIKNDRQQAELQTEKSQILITNTNIVEGNRQIENNSVSQMENEEEENSREELGEKDYQNILFSNENILKPLLELIDPNILKSICQTQINYLLAQKRKRKEEISIKKQK